MVKSLAYGKPILARSIPTTCAIKERIGDQNLILYSSTEDLINQLRQGFPQWRNGATGQGRSSAGWDAVTEEIGNFLCEVSRSVSFQDVLVPRLQFMRLLEEKEELRIRCRKAPHDTNDSGMTADGPPAACRDELRAALSDRESQIQDIYHSWSWRITAPLRRMADVYLGLKRKV